jgi:hypothetical protein
MKAYSEDLRRRVVAAVDEGCPGARPRVSGVGRATVKRYLALRRATGALARARAAARTHEALAAAIWAALKAISPADARGYFTHCGYPPLAQHA